jgi:hypothetical protein
MPQTKQSKRRNALLILNEAYARNKSVVRPGAIPTAYTQSRLSNLARMITQLEAAISRG